MATDKQKGCQIFECDVCGELFEGVHGETFTEVWNRAKRAGWKSRRHGGGEGVWTHGCEIHDA